MENADRSVSGLLDPSESLEEVYLAFYDDPNLVEHFDAAVPADYDQVQEKDLPEKEEKKALEVPEENEELFEFPVLVYCRTDGYQQAYMQDGITWEDAVFNISSPLSVTGHKRDSGVLDIYCLER